MNSLSKFPLLESVYRDATVFVLNFCAFICALEWPSGGSFQITVPKASVPGWFQTKAPGGVEDCTWNGNPGARMEVERNAWRAAFLFSEGQAPWDCFESVCSSGRGQHVGHMHVKWASGRSADERPSR
jgi:hypothetical protein